MRMLIFSVFDSAVGAHLQPFFSRSMGEAIRSFQDACNQSDSQFNRHASDYTLFLHGSFDDAGGVFDTSPPERVSSALELIFHDPTGKAVSGTDGADTPAAWGVNRSIKIGQR